MPEWKKSSYSNSFSNCVEVAWRRSSHRAGGTVLVRDSKDPDGPVLTFTSLAWDAFVQGVRAGEFGLR
jgi:Domain of unknown function (DUF397)